MKTPSKELFQLVKSLDSREKAFFRMSISRSPSGIRHGMAYVILFEELNSLREFNEETLRQKLAKKGVVGKLSFLKNYLFSAILKSLEDYHSETRYSIQMNQMLIQADILINKNLFTKAFTIIKKGEEIARRTENFLFMAMFKRLRYTTLFSMNEISHFDSFRKVDAPEFFEVLKQEENLLRHNLNAIDNTILQSRYDWNNPGSRKKFKDLHRQFAKADDPLSITAKRSDLTMLMLIAARDKKYRDCIKYLDQIEKLFYRGGDEYILFHVESFFRMYQNKVLFHFYCSNIQEIHLIYERSLQFFNKLPEKMKFPKVIGSFLRIEINFCGILLLLGDTEAALPIINKLNRSYSKYQIEDPLLFRLTTLLYVNYYFTMGSFSNANIYLLKLLNTIRRNNSDSQTITIMLLKIISLLELREFDQMENAIRSTTRLLKSNDLFHGSREIILGAVKNISKEMVNGGKGTSAAVAAKRELFKSGEELPYYSDDERSLIILWLDSKIRNRSILDIVRERAKGTRK